MQIFIGALSIEYGIVESEDEWDETPGALWMPVHFGKSDGKPKRKGSCGDNGYHIETGPDCLDGYRPRFFQHFVVFLSMLFEMSKSN